MHKRQVSSARLAEDSRGKRQRGYLLFHHEMKLDLYHRVLSTGNDENNLVRVFIRQRRIMAFHYWCNGSTGAFQAPGNSSNLL